MEGRCGGGYGGYVSGQGILVQGRMIPYPCVAHCFCNCILIWEFPGGHVIKPCQNKRGLSVWIADGVLLLYEFMDGIGKPAAERWVIHFHHRLPMTLRRFHQARGRIPAALIPPWGYKACLLPLKHVQGYR